MRKYFVILLLFISTLVHGQDVAINFDGPTITAMGVSYIAANAIEKKNLEYLDSIASNYTATAIATAGILYSKRKTYKAMRNAGTFEREKENAYYKRLRYLVTEGIMPSLLSVGSKFIKHPENFLRWGPYLYRTTTAVENLCKQFEFVCTNGKLSFSDVKFLVLNDGLQKLCDLAHIDGLNYQEIFEKLAHLNGKATIEKVKKDLENIPAMLAQAGKQVLENILSASANKAGLSSQDAEMLHKINGIGDAFHCSPAEIIDLYNNFKDKYNRLHEMGNLKDQVMSIIKTSSVEGLRNLFDVSLYDIQDYILETMKETHHKYYRQRWYIVRVQGGQTELCNYNPYMNAKFEWVQSSGINKTPKCSPWWIGFLSGAPKQSKEELSSKYNPSQSDLAYIKQVSEQYAGWNEQKVKEYNQSNSGHNAEIKYRLCNKYLIEKTSIFGYQRADFFAYEIKVTDTFTGEEEVYSEVFDSQNMKYEEFQEIMQNHLYSFTSLGDGFRYELRHGEEQPYSESDEAEMKKVLSVDYFAECHDGKPIQEGNFQWKENGNNKNLSERSKGYAMGTIKETNNTKDIKELEKYAQKLKRDYENLAARLKAIEEQRKALVNQIRQANLSGNENLREELQKKYNQLTNDLQKLENELSSIRSKIDEVNKNIKEYYDDLTTDNGPYRIINNMRELQSTFMIQWDDEGKWGTGADKYTFTRRGNSSRSNCKVKYTADLTMLSPEKYFLFFRSHRSIMKVLYKLSTDGSSNNFIETMPLSESDSEQQKADKTNKRLHELMQDFPDCTVSMRYNKKGDKIPKDSLDDTGIHYLWSCDRIDVARKIEGELTNIYAELATLDHFLTSEQTIWDFFKTKLLDVLPRQARGIQANHALERWEESNRKAKSKLNS